MKLITVTKKTKHKTDQMEMVISILCLVEGKHLSKTDKRVLAFFVVHGLKDTTEDLIINSKVVTDMSQLRNIKSKLTRLKFLKKEPNLYKSYELAVDKSIINESVINLLIKVDNS